MIHFCNEKSLFPFSLGCNLGEKTPHVSPCYCPKHLALVPKHLHLHTQVHRGLSVLQLGQCCRTGGVTATCGFHYLT